MYHFDLEFQNNNCCGLKTLAFLPKSKSEFLKQFERISYELDECCWVMATTQHHEKHQAEYLKEFGFHHSRALINPNTENKVTIWTISAKKLRKVTKNG